jgi:hypothetical protein
MEFPIKLALSLDGKDILQNKNIKNNINGEIIDEV